MKIAVTKLLGHVVNHHLIEARRDDHPHYPF